ncbi:MAG: ATP-dependent helicase [Bradymonadales bacterium]|nr:ATP-dependent helicase [Bradymonadales bacterium]
MGKRVYTIKEAPPRVAYRIDYESLLNEQQRDVVFAGEGSLLVLAGAGTGKTRTLTYRVARLLESGVPAERILLLTFTNKAAREMLGRVGNLLGELPKGLWGGTFHHIGNLILRRHAEAIGYKPEFTILDSEDAQTVMGLAVAEAGVDVTRYRFPKAKVLCRLHSLAVNRGQSVSDTILREAPYFSEIMQEIERVSACYGRRKREMGGMDYDDLLVNWRLLFEEHEEFWLAYAERFLHVLVDEYQDTNQIQGVIIDHCARLHNNLMVVGDDCQSIYAFRGADYSNILEFPKRHPGTRIFKLETNYRSTPQILNLANDSIRFNPSQYKKRLRSAQPDDMLPAVVDCRDLAQQAAFIAQRVLEIREEGVELNEIAVLYRAHYQSMELQVELAHRGIPYIVRSGVRFFEQAHIKDVLSFIRLVINPRDELAFRRVLYTADGIGKQISDRIWRQLGRYEEMNQGWGEDGIVDSLPKRAAASWDALRRLLIRLDRMREEGDPSRMIDLVCEGWYQPYIRKTFENYDNRLADINQLANFAAQHRDVKSFLDEVSLNNGIASEDVIEGGRSDEALVLSSIHQAKGLEFRAVFLIWLAEGRFPIVRGGEEVDVEEERRLFYVAVTRAKNELYLIHPISVRERNRGFIILRRSPFLTELSSNLYENWVLTGE